MASRVFTDTIFSLSSAPGRAGVSVFRLSGPKTGAITKTLTGRALPAPRLAALRRIKDSGGAMIDEGLVLWMPGPKSFTGEDCAEFQLHGSPAVLEAMASAFLRAGARQSEAGEFTRRAFENGRLDLTEAEGLADLIDAETQGQRLQALRQMQGGLKAVYEEWRSRILDALAQIEGEIDFPDEGDIPDGLSHKSAEPLKILSRDISKMLSTAERGEHIRAGIDIAIIGPPNAGKSSLINRVVGRDAAIVTDQAGTTREVLEMNLELGGLPIRLLDTAGLRESDDVIEAEGVRRARRRAESAQMRLVIFDAQDMEWQAAKNSDDDSFSLLQHGDFLVLNKSDLGLSEKTPALPSGVRLFSVSALTGEGLPALLEALEETVREKYSPLGEVGLTRARHKDCVERAKTSIDRAHSALGRAPELAGDDLRAALQALRELAGETDIEAVFDRIFSRFCVGK